MLFFLLSQTVHSVVHSEKNNRQALLSRYPYGLLTDDYGILNEDDLKVNTCMATPSPFSEKKPNSAYSYWQCFEVKTAKLICEGRKYDPDEKTRVTWLVLSAKLNGASHEYMARRNMPVRSCELYQKEWRKHTRNEKRSVCQETCGVTKRKRAAIRNGLGSSVGTKQNEGAILTLTGSVLFKHSLTTVCVRTSLAPVSPLFWEVVSL